MQLQLNICYSIYDHRIALWTCTRTLAGKTCDSK